MIAREVCLLGPGLLGGSIAGALKACSPQTRVRMWGRRTQPLEYALASGLTDTATTELSAAVAGADLVIFCTPVETMATIARSMRPALEPSALITDVGSVKASVMREVGPILEGSHSFLGSHPMAGSEKTGIEAAKPDLFKGATCIITPCPGTPAPALEKLTTFWKLLGMHVIHMDAETHDRIVAAVSHLPHIVAAALVETIRKGYPGALACAGPGYRDTTRVAAGSPAMWLDILMANREEILPALRMLGEEITKATDFLENCDRAGLLKFLEQARAARDPTSENIIPAS